MYKDETKYNLARCVFNVRFFHSHPKDKV